MECGYGVKLGFHANAIHVVNTSIEKLYKCWMVPDEAIASLFGNKLELMFEIKLNE